MEVGFQSERHQWFDYHGRQRVAVIQDLSDIYGFFRLSMFNGHRYAPTMTSGAGKVQDFNSRAEAEADMRSNLPIALNIVWC